MISVEITFTFFMGFSINFNGMASMQNKFQAKQTNSSLLATKMLLKTVFCMGHYQNFQLIATTTTTTTTTTNRL